MKQDYQRRNAAPIVIGGVGGSGTRLIAQCLMEIGYQMGYDLNEANDNLWFTLLFKRRKILSAPDAEFDALLEIMFRGMTGAGGYSPQQIGLINALASRDRELHPAAWLRQRAASLLAPKQPQLNADAKWGWKEPNSHMVLDRLAARLPDMKYIHVARNGLDMAYSSNQNQLRMWGPYFIAEPITITPHHSLKYWCAVHRRVIGIGNTMGANFLFLNYDDFCSNPERGVRKLCAFLGPENDSAATGLTGLIHAPDSIGRFKQNGLQGFAREDVEYVRELGFDAGAAGG